MDGSGLSSRDRFMDIYPIWGPWPALFQVAKPTLLSKVIRCIVWLNQLRLRYSQFFARYCRGEMQDLQRQVYLTPR